VLSNPAWRLAALLASLQDDEGRVTLPGFYDAVRPLPGDEDLVARMPFDPVEVAGVLGVDRVDFDGPTYWRRLMLEPLGNISGMLSGYTGPGTKTIIPARAGAKLDFRLVPEQEPADVFASLKAYVEARVPGASVRQLEAYPPSRTDHMLPICQSVVRAVERCHQRAPILQPNLGATLPDYVFTRLLSIPSVGVPYANADQANHSPDENLRLDCFINGIKTSAQVLYDLGRA